jgi:hypothetical protein
MSLKDGRRHLQSVKPEVQLQLNLTDLELPDRYVLLQRTAKESKRCCKEEGSKGRRGRKKEMETQAQTVLTLGLDQITKFVYRLDGSLGEGKVWWFNSDCVKTG